MRVLTEIVTLENICWTGLIARLDSDDRNGHIAVGGFDGGEREWMRRR